MNYYPQDSQLYSTTGCKHVSQKVDMLVEEVLFDIESKSDDEDDDAHIHDSL